MPEIQPWSLLVKAPYRHHQQVPKIQQRLGIVAARGGELGVHIVQGRVHAKKIEAKPGKRVDSQVIFPLLEEKFSCKLRR
jgi:hypothetical protein